MPAIEQRRSLEAIGRLGTEVYARLVRPSLRPEDNGKFVAVDIDTGDYEVDKDDYAAVMRLRARNPAAEIWLEMAGQPTACKIRRGR